MVLSYSMGSPLRVTSTMEMLPKESKDCLCKIVVQELLIALRLSLGLKRAIFLPSPYSSLYTSKDTGANSLVSKGCESKDGTALQLHGDTGQNTLTIQTAKFCGKETIIQYLLSTAVLSSVLIFDFSRSSLYSFLSNLTIFLL